MIVALMHAHVGAGGHVAGDALRGRACRVVGVGWRVEPRRIVAGGAGGIARRAQLQAMRFVAIRAGDARAMHFALQERAGFEHLVADLAVGEIEAIIEQRQGIAVVEGPRSIGILRSIGQI